MEYILNPKQRELIKAHSKEKWCGGDDNDFSCFLASVATDVFVAGDITTAYEIYRNDPMAMDDMSLAKFITAMQARIDRINRG